MKKFISILILILFISSCSKDDSTEPINESETFEFSESPIDLQNIEAKYIADFAYDTKERTKFDIWLPESDTPTGLVIYIHGGGFTGGDKSFVNEIQKNGLWNFPDDIHNFLNNNIAVATINYSLLQQSNEPDGVLKSLTDSKRAIQFIKSRADDFNINKNNIVLAGNSAGAGTSLWIGTKDDMADPNSIDPVLRESTRVKGIAIRETQATYDVERWTRDVMPDYGVNFNQISQNSAIQSQIARLYGISTVEEYNTPEIIQYRADVDMLALITSDDPEIFINNTLRDAENPFTGNGDLLHHPYHARAIKQFADMVSVTNITYYEDEPSAYNHPSGETWAEFIIRKINE